MKKIFYILLILPLVLFSCKMSPRAYFSASPGDPVVGEDVWFTNETDNAVDYEWDFGDGYISYDMNPIHKFTASGQFTVVLKAWSSNGLMDEASLTLEVKIPTLLEIEVLEYYDLYPVEGASVILYPSLTDWENETDMINEGFTDSEGIVVFADLENKVHYVDVWEATHDNYTLKEEDIGFIRTSEIIPNKINRFIAYVDYVDHGKGVARRNGSIVIRKIERKSTDRPQPEVTDNTAGWEELFSRSVVMK
jgi:PKD repeat protein